MRRLNIERFKKKSWLTIVPDHVKITDAEIERFVNIVKDVTLLSVYSKSGSFQAASAMQNLSLLRADLILPSLLDRLVNCLLTYSLKTLFRSISLLYSMAWKGYKVFEGSLIVCLLRTFVSVKLPVVENMSKMLDM